MVDYVFNGYYAIIYCDWVEKTSLYMLHSVKDFIIYDIKEVDMFKKTICLMVAVLLFCSSVFAVGLELPVEGAVVKVSESFDLPFVRGVRFDAHDPLSLEFIFDMGDELSVSIEHKNKLIRYFLAALTVPSSKLWVNLSPYEKERVIDDSVATTEMGETLLAQDYLLKQLSSSLTHPDTSTGKAYWKGQESSKNDSFNKIWIKPGKISLYDENNLIMISDALLEIESESSDKEVLIPAIARDVNSGRNFAELRQMYYSVILAQYFKRKFSSSLYSFYFDKEKMNGVNIADPEVKDEVFKMYVSSFENGAYNITRKENVSDPAGPRSTWTGARNVTRKVKRHYFFWWYSGRG